MADPIRNGVVGLGCVGQARHIPTITGDRSFQLVGVADRREDRARSVASQRLKVRSSAGERLSEIDWIDDVDAISVATAPMAHHDLVREALDRGLHVITEKPFAMSVAEGRAMLDDSNRAAKCLAVVHNFQFARSMQRLKRDLADGKLGTIRGLRAIQLGNPSRRLPAWYEDLPLGLFYDESPHLLYLLSTVAGDLSLVKAVSAESRHGNATPAQLDAWFAAEGASYPITLSCNFESSLSEWHLAVHGEKAVAIIDIFRDIYLRLPNDGRHGTVDVLRTSISATSQHWWQHLTSGVPHLAGKLRYGNDEVFNRFGRAIRGDSHAVDPINAAMAQRILTLQHAIISEREKVYA
jgi:scyllo-inositol 2-dehydrogenase (NADP+)